ncbi:unnamed protein product, partial [Tilletia laevis]
IKASGFQLPFDQNIDRFFRGKHNPRRCVEVGTMFSHQWKS